MAAMAWANSGGFGGLAILHSTMIGLVTFFYYIKIIMTATNIRIMEEIAENKSFRHNFGASVCAQPVRLVQRTGQTGMHGLHATMDVDQPVRPVTQTGQTGLHGTVTT